MSLNKGQKDIAGLLAEWRELADGVSHDMATEFDTDGDFNITLYADPDDETSEQAVANLKFLRLAPVAIPALLAAVENVLKLHRPYGVYDECDCLDEQKDDGHHIEVDEVGLTCNHLYDVCAECCTDDGYLTEACSYHDHGKDVHICPTVAAIRDALGGAE